jgi:hypothetical protein
MGVFRNENAAALLYRDTQQQEKWSRPATVLSSLLDLRKICSRR